ncbi:MAG: glycosyl hydrolase, partial [Candidatus Sumerlaeota bacterium]|nr:glycosyl hydrolase [Candidatus Sumerlaeota bacterium]
ALSEAQRLGLKIATCPCAGWCALGGPWITPEQSMQVLVWSETPVRGPKRFQDRLPQPQTVLGFYRDVAVLAVPSNGCSLFRRRYFQALT